MPMPQPDNTPAWFAAGLAGLSALWMLLRRLFVTQDRLNKVTQELNAAIEVRHEQNGHRFDRQDKELKEISSAVARIEGQLSGRYPRIER